ncbi:acyl-CoA dehydrogenase [Rathayibacter rathayi]|uniref:Acyl-CoA dehydrogenase n=1 Tax=Rathayibacter rathayi TaxID=33887 RepID=A0ABD6WA42_RATRA|nr:acyl-CoA carboxylase epsilon subunit [Rathayibacter rathayi]AZZ49361.1 acyl-CoA dehydrogenase [Rathayibacter rathayi]MWV73458.1 acyl-CoA carboxylase subunit epsilon [Rathayibacter rathayi NCPPB 2980 = VKM Ac-1601]PPF14990.1 acyl-CoA dehydrogenase [Rathayibacter rathayi]PPF24607.1 acyl-CoA dehydrogenase [Rathayibacter rathayi]PPF50283.1 acyl-CoA dehydrogenase [Rathayibacter rathayi]
MVAIESAPAVVISTPGLGAAEIAAVTAVVTAVASRSETEPETPREFSGGWNDRAGAVRSPLRPALGAWRSFSG